MQLLTAILLIGSLSSLLTWLATYASCKYHSTWKHLGKSWIFILPETQGTEATVLREKLKDGKVDIPTRNHDGVRGDLDRLLPQGNVAYHAKGAISGPLHVMSSYGANLVAPPKLQAAEVIEKIAVADWLANYKRQPTTEEAKPKGAFFAALEAAQNKAKEYALSFLIWDPGAYFKACRENDMQDFLNAAGGAKDPWYAKAAFVGVLICGALLLILLAMVGMKVLPAIQAGGS